KFIALALALLWIAGCSKNDGAPPVPAGGGGGGGSSAGGTGEVTFKTSDDWTIHGDYYPATDAKGAVVLLHQRGGSASDWRPIIFKLTGAKVSALALDQRGAGRSAGKQNGDDAPWDTSKDIEAAIDWLKSKGVSAEHIGLAGASYGANNAMI